MNKGCQYEEKARKRELGDESFAAHLAACDDCRETQKIADWMQNFAAQTPAPQNLRSPGFLMIKARLRKKQNAAARAVQPIFWMQIASVLIFVLGVVWVEVKSDTPVLAALGETFDSLSKVAPIFFAGIIVAGLICFAFAYMLRRMKL